jgi:hypothetical protein
MVLIFFGRLVDRIYPDHSSIDDYLGLLKKKNESRRTVRRAAGLSTGIVDRQRPFKRSITRTLDCAAWPYTAVPR